MKNTASSLSGTQTPSSAFIPLIVPEIRGNEWQYVKDCLDTAWVSSVGSYVDRFEEILARKTGTKYGVATVNGTSALHVSLLVAGVQPNDEVLVSTLTFIAPVNAIRYVGAWPVFIDAEPKYWQMNPERVSAFLENDCEWRNGMLVNKGTGRRVSAIVPVHILGHPVDMDPIMELAKKFQLHVIEDATEGLGALYKGKPLGQLGHIGCFSFNGNKIITTGGGGMIVTDNSEWARKAKHLTTQAKDDPVEYIHNEVGFNYRLTNVQAAIGCAQMEQLDAYVARKREIAGAYYSRLKDIPNLALMQEASSASSTYWMYTVLLESSPGAPGSREVLQALARRKIQTRPLWQPNHLSPAHRGGKSWSCPVAERLGATALSLPCSVGLTDSDQTRVVDELRHILAGKSISPAVT